MKKIGQFFIESQEISITQTPIAESGGEHLVGDKYYTYVATLKTEIKSLIYTYDDGRKVLTTIVNRFGLEYFKVVIFNDGNSKAWNLIELPCELDVRIRRLGEDMFLVIGYSKKDDAKKMSAQFSFCRLKPSTKVEEQTMNVHKIKGVKLTKEHVIINYEEVVGDKILAQTTTYNHNGTMISTKEDV